MTATSGFSFLAPAKLNISLKVFGKRADGYHNIRTVMVPVSLYDEVSVEEAESGIRVESDDPAVPVDDGNTCHRAAALFMEWAGEPKGVRICLRKRIPVEAGLGGGSSDAAATLKGMMALTGRIPSPETLLGMAARVGADVPFFTMGRPAVAEGAGERLTPVEWGVPFFSLIVKPPFGLSTREGYAMLRRGTGDDPPDARVPAFRGWEDLVPAVSNDFEAAWGNTRPEIGEIKRELLSAGALAAGLSGSGSAVFGLFGGAKAALDAQGMLSRNGGRRIFVAQNI
ncbi:MAG: 4-(cytidine 5'-diphospho)-2-C-methyl-D-erythritol kinase [Deltaproteobacteria bacterium]|nr:4-(cytidine 5'-diphospho)-2-C-methyl-D-erythritol kinase [Deltaproteobacteria bacterium]